MSAKSDGDDQWIDPATQTVWTRPTAWAYAQVCRVNEERRVQIDHLQTVSTDQVLKIRALEADKQRLLDIVANTLMIVKAANGQSKTETVSSASPSPILAAQRAAVLEEVKNVYEPLRKAAEQVVHASSLIEAKQAIRLMNSELLKLKAIEAKEQRP